MSNKYCNLDGTKKIRDDYPNINKGFDQVEADTITMQSQIDANKQLASSAMQSHLDSTTAHSLENITYTGVVPGQVNAKGALDATYNRVEQIITTPISDAAATQEIVDARNSTIKGVGYVSLDARFEAAEADIEGTKAPQSISTDATNSIIALPTTVKEGLLSAKLKGRTYANAVTNGDFINGTTGWTLISGVTLSVNNNVCSVIGDGTTYAPYIGQMTATKIIIGNRIYVKSSLKVTNSVCTKLQLQLKGSVSGVIAKDLNTPVQNTTNLISNVCSLDSTFSGNLTIRIVAYYADAATASGKVMEVQQVMAVDLTVLGDTETDVAKLDAKYPFVNGTASVEPIRLKSVGKNLFDGKLTLGMNISGTDGTLFVNAGSNATNFIRTQPNTSYVKTSVITRVAFYDANKQFISYVITQTFTTPANCAYLRCQVLDANLNDFQLELGSTTTVYEPYVESLSYSPIDLKGLQAAGVYDELDMSNGLHTKRISDWYTLLSTDVTSLVTTGVNLDYVTILKKSDYIGYNTTNAIDGRLTMKGAFGDKTYADDTTTVGYLFNANATLIGYAVAKGTYANLAAAQADLVTSKATKILYQLTAPIVTQINNLTPLIAKPSGTIFAEKTIRFTAKPVAGVITIPNLTYTIESVTSLKKIVDLPDGEFEYQDATVTSNTTTTITVTNADNTSIYEVVYQYYTALGTIPTINYTYPTNLIAAVTKNTTEIVDLASEVSEMNDFTVAYLINLEARLILEEARKAATQADSVAVDVVGLKMDFNALLAKLKTAKLMA